MFCFVVCDLLYVTSFTKPTTFWMVVLSRQHKKSSWSSRSSYKFPACCPWHTSAWWDPVITMFSFYHLMESIKEATAFTWLGMSNKFLSLVSLMWFLICPHAPPPESFHPQKLLEPFLRIKSYTSLCYMGGPGQSFCSGIWSSSTFKMWLVL